MEKKNQKVLIALYVFFILWMTLFTRDTRAARIFRGLFWEARMGYWWDIVLNILLFIPLGFLLGDKGWKAILYGFLLSAFIELIQYIAVLGYCEADDVLNNTIGTAVGYLMATLLRTRGSNMYRKVIKNVFDFLIGLCGFPFFLLALIIFGPIIYFTDKGPVFYNANRIGKDGKLFKMYKFRSMYVNAPDIRLADGSTYNGEDDPRVTKIGKFMRATSIDELPQLLNLLNGTMSLIGPRPDPPDWLDKYPEDIKVFLTVKPGLTGYSQAYYRNSADGEEKMKNDAYYAKNCTFWMDVKIFFKTIAVVLGHDNTYKDTSDEEEANKLVEELRKL